MNPLVTLAYADDIIQAHMMVGVLEVNGIKAAVEHGMITTLIPYVSKGVNVVVLESDFDAARCIIDREFPGY